MYKQISKYITILLCFAQLNSHSQTLSANGQFSIDQYRGCAPFTVNAYDHTGIASPIYVFENDSLMLDSVYTYSNPGQFWMAQYTQGATGEKKDSLLITIYEPIAPDVTLQTCNGFQLQVLINNNYYDDYEINYGNGTIININNSITPSLHSYGSSGIYNITVTGSFNTGTNKCGIFFRSFNAVAFVQPATIHSVHSLTNNRVLINYSLAPNSESKLEVATNGTTNFQFLKKLNYDTTSDTLTNLLSSLNNYCFRISTFDSCSPYFISSDTICTIRHSIISQNGQNNIEWNTEFLDNTQTYSIYKDSLLLNTHLASTYTYSDNVVVCGNNYCYYLRKDYSNGSFSTSEISCTEVLSNLPPTEPKNISSINNGTNILWSWPSSSTLGASYKLYYVTDRGFNILQDTINNTYYSYSVDNSVISTCIKLKTLDACYNESIFSETACSIVLEVTDISTTEYKLTWNDYQGWENGVQEYFVVEYDKQGVTIDSISVGSQNSLILSSLNYNDQQSFYTIYAIPNNFTLSPSRSNITEYTREPIISLPSSFTPNGDNLNDNFKVKGKFISETEMFIFNRWGSLIFSTNDIETGWNGTVSGSKAPTGNYTYKLTVKDFVDNHHIRTGTVLILRN